MNTKQWYAWLLVAGITTLISVVSILQSGEQIDTNNTRIILANMTKAQKDSVMQAEIRNAKVGDEIISLRKKNTKIFKDKNGKFNAKMYSSSRHYFDEETGTYKNIDLTINEIANEAKSDPTRKFDKYVDAGNYRATWFDDNPHDYTFYYGDYYVKYEALFDTTGITIQTKSTNSGIKQDVILNGSTATNVLSWKIHSNALYELNNGSIVFKDTLGTVLFNMPSLWAEDENWMYVNLSVNLSSDTLTCTVDIPQDAVYPITIDPSTTILEETDANTGYLLSENAVYLTARNSTTAGTVSSSSIIRLGQASSIARVWRGCLEFDTSSLPDDASVDSVKIVLVSDDPTVNNDFYMHIVEGNWAGSMSTGWFNDFVGWASSGTYSITDATDSISTAGISSSDTVRFKFTEAGITALDLTGTSRFMMLSSEDIIASAGSGNGEAPFFKDDPGYLQVWYLPKPIAPSNFTMDNPSETSIIAHYTRNHSASVDSVAIANSADSSTVKYYDSATDTITTVTGLSANTNYSWLAYVDSAGIKSYSNTDNLYTSIDPPGIEDITIQPISSDTLHISVTEPPNPATGLTGMQVEAVSGSGATSSGWLDGQYSYLDGGVDPDSTHVYKVRYRNGDGVATDYSPEITYEMNGIDTLVVNLAGDTFDDYNIDFGSGQRDSTVVRAGTSDSGERLDGFLSFSLPWQVVNGGVDSLFLTMNRVAEESSRTPSLTVYGITVKFGSPIEERTLGTQDSTSATAGWTVSSGTGSKTSPNLRNILNEWREISSLKDFSYDFGVRIDDSSQADSVRAVFLDSSHPSYSNDTKLTVYYTPGIIDYIEGAPGSFAMTALTADSIRASWTDNSVSEYGFVLLNLADSTLAAGTDSLAQNTTSIDVGGLTPNTLYEWFVRAYTAGDDSSSSSSNGSTSARIPGLTTVSPVSSSSISFIIDPEDNPSYTQFAVQDSITGLYVDGAAEPDTLREGPPGNWGWRTFPQWGSSQGDTLTGLAPDSLYVLRTKARSGE